MAIPLDAAAQALREAMRETVKRYSLWYLIQGVLLVVAGALALIYPFIASVALVFLLAWILIVSGILQGIGLIGATNVPHYWLQLISAVLAILIIFALTIRPFPNWGWILASGFVGIVLSLILWANMPLSSDWVLGLMLGILLVCEGAALTYLAWHVRTAASSATASAS